MVPQRMLKFITLETQINGDNLNNIRHEARRHFKNKMEYLKGKINQLAMNSMNKNIGDLYRGIN
jgi:hypothetical protein